jgi:acyl carrier protein
MDPSFIEQKVRDFIINNFLFGDTSKPLGNHDSFLAHGIIDSTGVLELVSFIEETFGIAILDEELVPENLDTLHSLACFIQRKSEAISRQP